MNINSNSLKCNESQLVSIITVVYNDVTRIEQAVNSVLNQTYSNIEYIVIDGGSFDGTKQVLEKHKDKFTVYLSEKDNGVYHAMNKGLSYATGSLIGILNSDDFYELDAVEKVVSCFNNNPQFDIFYGLVRQINQKNLVEAVLGFTADGLSKNMIQHPSCFVTKGVYNQYGLFNTKYRYAADYEFMLRVKQHAAKFYFIEEILANFREGGISSSQSAIFESNRIKYQYRYINFGILVFNTMFLYLKKIILKIILK